MVHSVFVISDLHLGGEPGHQICPPASQVVLADFLAWVADQCVPGHEVHLVVNGDTVDFLAERPFSAFTSDDDAARAKLQNIICRTQVVWKQFAAVVKAGAQVTLTLGNHDLELSLPGPRRLLLDTLGPGRVEFLYDNQALAIGDVLIEHGNRYDDWNMVRHDSLRQVRSRVSRNPKMPGTFKPPAGSCLVIEVMNELKQKYRFVDLLKPENEGVVPILAALDPRLIAKISRVLKYKFETSQVKREDTGAPVDPNNIAYDGWHPSGQAWDLALELAGDPNEIGFDEALDWLEKWKRALQEKAREKARENLLHVLYRALRHYVKAHIRTMDAETELAEYIKPAEQAARDGFRLITYGHTHLAKRVPLLGGEALYLNTGTWADIMFLPEGILLGDETLAKQELIEFVGDLEANALDRWRQHAPTFAKLELRDGRFESGDIYHYNAGGKLQPVKSGRSR